MLAATNVSQTDIFVLPSVLPDSFPTVILEAMASGKPVVATDSGGAREMVGEGETGFLIPIGDSNAGARRINELIEDNEKRILFGKQGRGRVLEEFGQGKFERETINHLWLHLAKD